MTILRRPRCPSRRVALAPLVLALAAACPAPAFAQTPGADPVVLDSLVITATRMLERSLDVPASVDRIDAATIQGGQPMVNLSETLVRVPGIVANNRQNYAQDLQISSRGFGARAAFGVRGVRLYQDDIPATMPDGQGQTGSFSLFSAKAIEVLRGPFSTLYGNASGGVITVFTEDGRTPPSLAATAGGGSFGTWNAGVKANGAAGDVGYVVAVNRFETDGYREHSAAVRDTANAKLAVAAGPDTRITVIGSHQYQPESLDPLGLTRTQWEADPRQVDVAARAFDTRKTIRQTQGGATIFHQITPEIAGRLTGYGGTRAIRQYLGLPGTGAASSGGVADLDRDFGGLGARLTWATRVASRPLTLTLGFDVDQQRERRRGYVNDGGQLGALRRDEDDRVTSKDSYVQAEWTLLPSVTVTAGVRNSDVAFVSDDHYVVPGNPDDSGRRSFSHLSPVVGVLWRAADALNLYASYGQGFETPTFAELAYRPGGTGLNFALDAATSRAVEAGMKAIVARSHRINVAFFAVDMDDEIVVNAATGGRTTYKNAGRTRRRGFEALWDGQWGRGLTSHVALSYLRAEFVDPFTSGTPPVTVTVPAGARLPGVAARTAYAELAWAPEGWKGFSAAVEVQHASQLYVNDRNSDASPAYTVANVRVGIERDFAGVTWRAFVRGNNLSDRRYAGSVIVGDANERYFEPAPGRNGFAGVAAIVAF